MEKIKAIAPRFQVNIFTTDEAAMYLGVTKRSLRRYSIPKDRTIVPNRVYYRKESLDDYLQSLCTILPNKNQKTTHAPRINKEIKRPTPLKHKRPRFRDVKPPYTEEKIREMLGLNDE